MPHTSDNHDGQGARIRRRRHHSGEREGERGMAGSRDFGNDLRDARQQAGLTQVKLAQQLDVDPGAISGWERGIRRPDDENRERVAAFMGLTLADYLVKDEATGQRDGPAPPKEEAGARKRAAEAQRLSKEELRLLRRLLARLEGTG